MTSKEKKDIIIKEVVKKCLKDAGYKGQGLTYYIEKDECYLAINIQNSQFNSGATGFTFWFNINAIAKDTPVKEFKNKCSDFFGIREAMLLPDCGFLHPYHNTIGYCIDGYKDYQQQDMDIEQIKKRINDDLWQEILPKFANINTLSEWKYKKEEWESQFDTTRISLLRYYTIVQISSVVQETILSLQRSKEQMGLSNAEIIANEDLYQQVRALSAFPNENKWQLVLASLIKE